MDRETMINTLQEMRDALVREREVPVSRKGSEIVARPSSAADRRQALAIFLAVLDDWIKGAKENHEVLDHRHENRGEECWRTFHASDIRNMINDAARELSLKEFPLPDEPGEDRR